VGLVRLRKDIENTDEKDWRWQERQKWVLDGYRRKKGEKSFVAKRRH